MSKQVKQADEGNPDIINNYIFQVGGCKMSHKARSKEEALGILRRYWPNGKIDFLCIKSSEPAHGVNAAIPVNTLNGSVLRGNAGNILLVDDLESSLTKKLGKSFAGSV